MKKITILIIALFVTVFATGQQQFSKEQKKLQQTVVNMFEALSNRDSIALKSFCIPDVTFYEYGQIWNIDTLIRKAITMNQSTDFKRTNTFDFINVETGQTKAWLTYRLSSVITRDSGETLIQWLETVCLVIQDRQWKVKHLHSTLIKRS
ncbi:MAG: nuclear transport factor 2 family protein [Ferruginibacter sp.]